MDTVEEDEDEELDEVEGFEEVVCAGTESGPGVGVGAAKLEVVGSGSSDTDGMFSGLRQLYLTNTSCVSCLQVTYRSTLMP